MPSLGKIIKEKVIPVLTVMTTIFSIYMGYSKHLQDNKNIQQDNKFKQLETEIKSREEKLKERESSQNYGLKIYEAVIKSLESENPQLQQAAKALVYSMDSKEPLRDALLNIFETSNLTVAQVRTDVQKVVSNEKSFFEEEKSVADRVTSKIPNFNWENWDYDIFWCEESGEAAKKEAENLVSELKKHNAKGRLRVRILPSTINVRPGYKVNGYKIRKNTGEEYQALALKELAQNNLGISFSLESTSQNTPYYISAFICP